MQVAAGGGAGAAHAGDHLTGRDALAGNHQGGVVGDVGIPGGHPLAVIDQHPIAVGAQPARLGDDTGARRRTRGSRRR